MVVQQLVANFGVLAGEDEHTLLYHLASTQICLLLQVFLDFLLCIPVPYNEKDNFCGVNFKRSCRFS